MKKENLKNSANTDEILRGKPAQNDGSGDRANTREILRAEAAQNDGKNESGRSMTEMLGVLAVIGVLSVGGIAGYTAAMRKHRANEIVSQLNMMAHECNRFYTQEGGGTNDCDVSTLSLPLLDYATINNVFKRAQNNQFYATITDMDKGICLSLVERLNNWSKTKIGTQIPCTTETENTLSVYFKESISGWAPDDAAAPDIVIPGETGSPCDENNHCIGNNYCQEGVCTQCESGTVPNEEKTACVECLTAQDCQGKTKGEFCLENNTCGCIKNTHCPDSSKYCKVSATKTSIEGSCYKNFTGSCQNKGSLPQPRIATITDNNGTSRTIATLYRKTDKYTSWWEANNWCEAHNLKMLTLQTPSNRFNCSTNVGQNGGTTTGACVDSSGNTTAEMSALTTALGGSGYWWVRETAATACSSPDECAACSGFHVYAANGSISKRQLHGNGYYYAVCEPK